MKKVVVIGYPVKHSLSPALHGYWLKQYDIAGEYGLLEVKAEDLRETLLGLQDKGYVGCNLTVPHKEAALEIIDEVTDVAKNIGAINTVYIADNGVLRATNTDAYGFIENIKQTAKGYDIAGARAVILGAGGACRAVIYGIMQEGIGEIILLNRSRDRAEKLQQDFSSMGKIDVVDWTDRNKILDKADLLVNTTSLGMEGQPELDIMLENLPKTALVTDIVYKPLETNLLKSARQNGNIVVDGLGMLLYQAVAGFEKWFGRKAEVTEELRQYVLQQIN